MTGHPKGPEGVGPAFSAAAMRRARDLTFDAVRAVAAGLRPGMTEGEAHLLAEDTLARLGAERLWHRSIVRFGEGTLSAFRTPPTPERVLKPQDIFFIDLGPVWGGHEGDAGDTFAVGEDPEMSACAEAARVLFAATKEAWLTRGLSGAGLYAFARSHATHMGWRLNTSVKGHRVSDFPHAVYKAGALGDLEGPPVPGLWVLEIQIRHPTRPFGAFFEDLLWEDEPDGAC